MEGKKVLILAHKPPYPKVDGGCIAIAQLLEVYLEAGAKVHFIGMETQKHPSKNPLKHPHLNYKTIAINSEATKWGALKSLTSNDSYFLARFKQVDFDNELIHTLQNNDFDIVIFESLFTSLYLNTVRNYSNAKTIYRSHNIEHAIWEMQEKSEKNILKKAYLKLQIKRLKKEELDFWKKVYTVVSISEIDTKYIKKNTTNSIETIGLYSVESQLIQADQNQNIDFFHLGAMDWQPNQQAITWLLENVWGSFHQKNTKTELHIAGRGMSDELINTKLPGLKNHQEVTDAAMFLRKHKVMLVPLFSGSGIRVKIIEGMAMGKCIITTSLGCQGINVNHLENILIANTKEEFIEQMEFCINKPTKVAQIGENAKKFAILNFSKSDVIKQLKSLFR